MLFLQSLSSNLFNTTEYTEWCAAFRPHPDSDRQKAACKSMAMETCSRTLNETVHQETMDFFSLAEIYPHLLKLTDTLP